MAIDIAVEAQEMTWRIIENLDFLELAIGVGTMRYPQDLDMLTVMIDINPAVIEFLGCAGSTVEPVEGGYVGTRQAG
jgi:hypothetical protein